MASVVLAVFAGLVAAVPMALLSMSRYGEQAFDRFVTYSDPPELVVNVCPPGVDPTVDGIDACIAGSDFEADARRIAELDHVRSTAVGGFVFAQGGAEPDPETWGPPMGGYAITGGSETAAGRPLVLEGRLAARDAPDEIVLTEHAVGRLGVGVGDELHLGAPGAEGIATSTVVGVVRIVDDLLPVDNPTSPAFHVRDGWMDAHADEVAPFMSVLVQTEDGRTEDVEAAMADAFGDRFLNSDPFLPPDQQRINRQALDFESGALIAVSIASALAGAAVIAQVVARRSRTELDQAPALRAIGATERFLTGATLLRWLPVAIGAGVVAVVLVALSPAFGPFGVARRAPWSSDPRLDWVVVTAGVVLLPASVLLPALLTVRRRSATRPDVAGSVGRGVVGRVASTFLRQSLGWRSVGSMATAVVVSAVALAGLMGMITVTSSLERVLAEPARFGAPYDALVPGAIEPDLDVDGIDAAVIFTGTDVQIGDDSVWVQAVQPVEGLPSGSPVTYEGRPPGAPDEVALGPVTLRDIGRSVGDTITIPDIDGEPLEYEIVGVAPITDGYEHNVGLGGLFTPEGLERLDPTAITNQGDIGVRVDPDRRTEALAALQQANPSAFVPFPVPSTLTNASRISDLPVFLAVGGAAVAAATFVHAFLLATRHRRRDLAVLRVLGMLRHQTFAVVTLMAGALAVLAAVLGGVLGLAAGGWGWQLVSEAFGLAPSAAHPILTLVAAPAAAVVVALVAASWPARRAANVRPARALRTD